MSGIENDPSGITCSTSGIEIIKIFSETYDLFHRKKLLKASATPFDSAIVSPSTSRYDVDTPVDFDGKNSLRRSHISLGFSLLWCIAFSTKKILVLPL